MSTGRGYLADLPHAPDQSSWDAFPESWPAPDGPEYLGRKIEEHDTTTRVRAFTAHRGTNTEKPKLN